VILDSNHGEIWRLAGARACPAFDLKYGKPGLPDGKDKLARGLALPLI